MRLRLIALVLSTALIGCQDREPIAAPIAPQAPAPAATLQRVAYISVSDLNPDAGSTIVVVGNVGVSDSLSVASFVARLAYDPTTLHYLDEVQLPDMMRVVNPQEKQITVAAASATGSSDGRLFKVRFRVDNPAGLASLGLSLDEMNDRQFNSQLSTLTFSPALHLDRSLVPDRVSRH